MEVIIVEESMFKNMLSNNLKKYRQNQKLKAIEVANSLNLSQSTISQYELGNRYPDLYTLYQLCKLYQITPNNLFNISNDLFMIEDINLLINKLSTLSENDLEKIELTINLIKAFKKK